MTGRTILIIDDNINLARGFATLLRNAGYTVHTAYTAADGLGLALLHQPDAIILDYQMPLINGVGFLYRLRELPSHRCTPVMIVTGIAISDEQRAEFDELHAVVKLKPIEVPDLLAETARLVTAPRNAPRWVSAAEYRAAADL